MKMSLGPYDSLKAWRRHAGLTQCEAAKILKVSQPSLCRWERDTAPKPSTAKRIAQKTGVPVIRILRLA